MRTGIRRREILVLGAGAVAAAAGSPGIPVREGVPRVDYHAHPEHDMTVTRAIGISKSRGVKFGLVQHAGMKESASSERLCNDSELLAWKKSIEGQPVFCGIQAEGLDWTKAFSKEAVARLDYVLSDALTMPDKSGAAVKLWTPAFHCDNAQEFMDRYVDFHLKVMATQPVDILANPAFLPAVLQPQYDKLWTEKRMRVIVEAAREYGIAIEINSKYRVPRMPFLELAKAAGLQFSFGSNAHDAQGIGDISYGVEMYRKLGLTADRFFRPAPYGRKPIQIRTLA